MKKLKIIDLSTLLPGPFATFLLSKYLPCEVWKFEDVKGDDLKLWRPTKDGVGLAYTTINKDKKIIRLSFRQDGAALIKDHVKNADICIHNFKAGRIEKYGLSFTDLVKINPDLLYVQISGYGVSHPLSSKSTHDLNILALCGYLSLQIEQNCDFSLPPIQLADILTSYQICLNILSRLLKGTKGLVEVSMYEAMVEALTPYNLPRRIVKTVASADNILSGLYPCYRLYKAKDGKPVAVAALENSLWVDFCHALKREDLASKQFDKTITDQMEQELLKYPSVYWLKDEFDFCVTPVLSINEAVRLGYA